MSGRAPRLARALVHVGLGLVVVVAVAAPWSALALSNLRFSPHVPWALPAGIAYVVLALAYLDGRGWPGSTSAVRRRDFRARPLALPELGWALLAGAAAVAALWSLYAASSSLSAHAPHHSQVGLSPVFLIGAVFIGAAVTAIAEEGGLRGFMQAPLERLVGPVPAIATTSLLFVLIHLSHGVEALARNGLYYLAAGLVYGLLAYLTQSILPSLLLHFLGDLLTFGLGASLVRLAGPRGTGPRVLLVVFALLVASGSAVAFLRLARLTAGRRRQERHS